MSGGYPRGSGDGLDVLIQDIREIQRRLRELEIPSGTQNASLVAQVQAKLAELDETVELLVAEYVNDFTYDTAEIDAKVASPGNIAPGNVTASGNVSSGGTLSAAGKISGDVWGNILTVDYRVVYASNPSQELGHVPSSIRFKTDVKPAEIDTDAMLGLALKTFKYKAAVEAYGSVEAAPTVLGLIAEEVAEAGLEYLVLRGEGGELDGVAYERLALPLLALVQQQQGQIDALSAAVSAIRAQLQ